jgi:hypothetical protein
MASASAAVTALQASTAKGMEVSPAPPVIRAKAAPAQPKAEPAPPSVARKSNAQDQLQREWVRRSQFGSFRISGYE